MRSIVRWFIKIFLCKIFYRVEFINKENEEKLNKCLICPNHSNTVEPAWIYSKTKDICIMAKAELFENKFLAKLYKYFGVFPIRRGEHDVRSIIHAINLFKDVDKRKLLIFPEGERMKKEQKRGVAKTGPVYIACKAHVPIVPVYITKNAKLFSRVKIIYGRPIYISEEVIHDKKLLKKKSEEILNTCYELKK